MIKRQMIALCAINASLYVGIGGLVGLLPVYLVRLGASPAVTGLFLACAYLALSLSNILGGWLSARFQRRPLWLTLGGILVIPVTWLMSQTTAVGILWLLMTAVWFLIGVPMAMVNILVGFTTEQTHRGRAFGLISVSTAFGLFLGVLISGPVVDRWGFPTLFTLVAVSFVTILIAGRFISDAGGNRVPGDSGIAANIGRAGSSIPNTGAQSLSAPSGRIKEKANLQVVFRNRTFALLFAASILAQSANIMIFLSRTLLMNNLRFDATAISRASSLGSLATLPLPLLIGWLADRVGRKPLIVACFTAPLLGLLIQSTAFSLWQFLVAGALATILGISTAVGSALVTDIFPPEEQSASISLLNITPWIGIVLGLTAGGAAISALQARPALWIFVLLSLVALLLLIPVSDH